jgi:Na+-driven multidrug efflux pump
VVLRLVAFFGTEAIAGYSIGILSIRLLDTIGQGFGNAVFTTVGQNLGARNPNRAVSAVWLGIRYSVLANGICILLLVLIAPWFVQIFTREPAVISIAVIVTRILAVSYAFTAVTWAFIRFFNGAGNTILPMLVDAAALCFFQFFTAYLLGWVLGWQTNGIWVAMAATCLIRAGMLFGFFQFSFKKHLFNKYMGQEAVA